jgi:hypothetical protein
MTETLFKVALHSLSALLGDVSLGRIGLPDI